MRAFFPLYLLLAVDYSLRYTLAVLALVLFCLLLIVRSNTSFFYKTKSRNCINSIESNLFSDLNSFSLLFDLVDEHKPSETIASKTANVTDNNTATVESIKSGDDNLDVKLAAEIPAADELKALNNLAAANEAVAAVNKTTTTVTVNVTQTKVVLDEVDKGQSIGEVVSTVSSIAEAAVNAIEKPQPPSSAEVASSEPIESSTIDNDIEMLEADDDCEMKDLSAIEEPQRQQQPQLVSTTTAAVDSTNNASAVVTSQSNEAEQKIDDVEKNISNLFNGDDNVGSTNDKSPNVSLSGGSDSLKITSANSQSNTDLHKNGMGGDEAANKDNNDLVSILAGSDKLDENISSSINVSAKSNSTTATTANAVAIENKLLKGITSTPSNYTSQSNVFNSTPIQKQFEISSENVSTISESGAIDTADQNAGVGGKAAKQEIISSHSSTTPEKSTSDLSTTHTGLFCFFYPPNKRER